MGHPRQCCLLLFEVALSLCSCPLIIRSALLVFLLLLLHHHHLRTPRNKLVQITYALANVYDDTPDLDSMVTEEHRQRSEDMMGCVESGDVTRLRECFLEVRQRACLGGGVYVGVCAYALIEEG